MTFSRCGVGCWDSLQGDYSRHPDIPWHFYRFQCRPQPDAFVL